MAATDAAAVTQATPLRKTASKVASRPMFISWLALAFITTSSVASLRAAPSMAVFGLAAVFLYIVPANHVSTADLARLGGAGVGVVWGHLRLGYEGISPQVGFSRSGASSRWGPRGNDGKDQRSFGFAQAFGRGTDSAQPWCFSAPERTGANACTKSTSWGSLVRAQYRPSQNEAICELWSVREGALFVPGQSKQRLGRPDGASSRPVYRTCLSGRRCSAKYWCRRSPVLLERPRDRCRRERSWQRLLAVCCEHPWWVACR